MNSLTKKFRRVYPVDELTKGGRSAKERFIRLAKSLRRYGFRSRYWISQFHPSEASVKAFWGAKLKVSLPQDISIALSGALPSEEREVTEFLLEHITEESVFYDVGSNFGFYSSLAEHLGAEIHSFEPAPAAFRLLDYNVGGFKNNLALSDKTGSATFYALGTSGLNGFYATHYPAIVVPTVSLDDYAKTHRAPTIMKIDVEGSEGKVVEGGLETLRTYHPLIVMEIWPGSKNGAEQLLASIGYAKKEIEGNNFIFRFKK